jgi:hypothetical protein
MLIAHIVMQTGNVNKSKVTLEYAFRYAKHNSEIRDVLTAQYVQYVANIQAEIEYSMIS